MAKKRSTSAAKSPNQQPTSSTRSANQDKNNNKHGQHKHGSAGTANFTLTLFLSVLSAYVLFFHSDYVYATAVNILGLEDSPSQQPATKDNIQTPDQTRNDIPEEVKNFKASWQKTFSVRKMVIEGRHVTPVQLKPGKKTDSSVRLYILDNFLSPRECDGLIEAHKRHIQSMDKSPLLCFDSLATLRSHLQDIGHKGNVKSNVFTPDTLCLNSRFSAKLQKEMHSNWSYSTAFYPEESKFSTVVATRIRDAMGLQPESGGKFQITSYPVGKAYKTHTDCLVGETDPRDRVVSVIMYLNDVTDGGETKFPDLGLSVKPKKGRALVWNNMSPEGVCEPHSKHAASVVRSGSKFILMRWYYFKNFYTIGKRQPEPHLPARGPTVPVVMCDVYHQGSCRWYDEWPPTVMTEYARR